MTIKRTKSKNLRADGTPKNRHAQALSKLGASKGGLARARNLTEKRKSEIGRMGAVARTAKWGDRWGPLLTARRRGIPMSSEE